MYCVCVCVSTVHIADVSNVSHENNHECVQPLSHWVGHYVSPVRLVCSHVLILTHTHTEKILTFKFSLPLNFCTVRGSFTSGHY